MKTVSAPATGLSSADLSVNFGPLDFLQLHALGLLTCVLIAVFCGWLVSNHLTRN